jgi:hypothetical protein
MVCLWFKIHRKHVIYSLEFQAILNYKGSENNLFKSTAEVQSWNSEGEAILIYNSQGQTLKTLPVI